MDLISGQPYWPVRDGLVHSYPPLHDDVQCDVAIVGGGITGALVAHHLAHAGLSAVVLDQRDVGMGSTAASTALLQYEIDVPLVELAELRGQDAAVRAYRACARAVSRLAAIAGSLGETVELQRMDSLFLARDREDVAFLERELAARRAAGLEVELLRAEAIAERFGMSREGALLSSAGAQVDPYGFAHALLRDASAHGARVFDRTRVTQVDVSGARCALRTEHGANVDAANVVIATGYETREFLEEPAAKLVSTYALVSGPGAVPPRWKEHPCIVWEHARPYLYLRTSRDGRVFVGGEDEPFRDPERRDALITRKTGQLVERYGELFAGATLEVAYAWAGTFGETVDGLAYIGAHPDWPHTQFALGYGGNGITYALLAAEIIRDTLLGKVHADADLFLFGR